METRTDDKCFFSSEMTDDFVTRRFARSYKHLTIPRFTDWWSEYGSHSNFRRAASTASSMETLLNSDYTSKDNMISLVVLNLLLADGGREVSSVGQREI